MMKKDDVDVSDPFFFVYFGVVMRFKSKKKRGTKKNE